MAPVRAVVAASTSDAVAVFASYMLLAVASASKATTLLYGAYSPTSKPSVLASAAVIAASKAGYGFPR